MQLTLPLIPFPVNRNILISDIKVGLSDRMTLRFLNALELFSP